MMLEGVLILIPAYRACESLSALIPALQQHGFTSIMVIDDGSNDQTDRLTERLKVTCLRHSVNRGKGQALWTGMQAAVSTGAEWIVCMDADGQHQPEDVQALLQGIQGERFVIGNRMVRPASMPWLRAWVNRGMSAWINRRLKTCIPDTQCGLRVYHRSVLPDRAPAFSRFAFETEELLRLVGAGVSPGSVEIPCRYNGSESYIRSVRDTLVFIKLMMAPSYWVTSSGVPKGPAD